MSLLVLYVFIEMETQKHCLCLLLLELKPKSSKLKLKDRLSCILRLEKVGFFELLIIMPVCYFNHYFCNAY